MTAVTVTVLVVVVLLSAFTVVGLAVLAWCDDRPRPLAAATLAGAAATVLWLCLVGIVVPPGSAAGAGALVAGGAALVGATWRRRPARLAVARRQVADLAVAVAVGLACVAPYLAIVLHARSTAVVHLSGSHDAFFFTAVPEWLTGHRAVGRTDVLGTGSASGTPLLGSVWDFWQTGGVRLGTESLTAALARLTRADPVNLWLPVTLAFHVLFVVAVQGTFARLRRPGAAAAVAAAAAGTTALLLAATTDQHTPTLLALALVLGLSTELADPAEDSRRPVPALLVAVLLGAVAASYSEVLVLVAPGLLALVVARAAARRAPSARWCGAVLGWTVVVAAVPWTRARQALLVVRPPEGYPSAFAGSAGWPTIVRRLALGGEAVPADTWARTGTAARAAAVAFVVVVAVGVAAVLRWGAARSWWAGVAVAATGGWWWLEHVHDGGYRQQRLVEWAAPLLVVASLLGWSTLADRATGRLGRLRLPPRATRPAAIGLVAALLIAAPGVAAARSVDDDPSRRVDAAFLAPDAWLAPRDPTGAQTVVWARSYLSNLWTPYVLRHRAEASYVSVFRDYYLVDHFGPLADRRWLLLDAEARAAATFSPAAVVAANPRFTLLDLRAGRVDVVVPPDFRGRWSARGLTVGITFDRGVVTCRSEDVVLPCP